MDTCNDFLDPHCNWDGAKDKSVKVKGKTAAGQDIVLAGYVGLEGSLRILDEKEEELKKRFAPFFIRSAKEQKRWLFTAREVKNVMRSGVTLVRGIGAGGVFAALWDLGEALKCGLEIELSKLSVRQETVEICEYYKLNPYEMASAGSFLIVTPDGTGLVKALKSLGKSACVAGKVTGGKAKIIISKAGVRYLNRPFAG